MDEPVRVLTVDDEPGMRSGVARALRGFTVRVPEVDNAIVFEVDEAGTGEEAVEKLRAGQFDIALLDLKLPGLSGLDVLDVIRESNMEIMPIMITAYASIETAVRATKTGAYDFLAKPFTPAELRETVRKATEHLVMTRRARQLAQEKRRVRFQFISVLAHELKAPLGAIEGYLRIIKDRTAGDNEALYEEILDRCMTRTDYMRKMIVDLLDLTRIESGQKKRDITEVDLRKVAGLAIDTVKPEAEHRSVTIELRAPETLIMQADRGEIEIILNNLISNALKYNKDGGRVDVTLSGGEETLKIEVADTGIGMTPEEAAKLFNEFVRIKNEKTRDILGSGLGLSIVKKLALLYGGDATVSSQYGQGSTFTVTLRRASEGAST